MESLIVLFRAMLTAHDGSVWIGSEGGGVSRFNGKQFIPFMKDDLPSDYIRSLFEDSQGNLWIGLREGLAQYRNGKFKIFTTKDGLAQNFIRVMGEDHEGYLWAGTFNGGIHRFENGKFVNYRDKGMLINAIRSILIDHHGIIWIGSDEGLLSWQNSTARLYTEKDGLPLESIFDIIEDREHTLWMGSYGGGLIRIKDGKIHRYTAEQGLSNDVILKILEDNRGNLWLSSLQGICCVSKQMLNDFAESKIKRIQCTAYNSSDGMIVSECSSPSGCKTFDGHLWFPTPKGIVVVDPASLKINTLPPPVVVERVVIDRVDYSPYTDKHFLPGSGQVEFYYGGMSFIAPQKVHFRYMLEGFEKEWRFVGTRREAYYTNLAPGNYVFHVSACNSDGVWNETGASFAFELEPHFYQTSWFYGLVLIAVGGTIFGGYRLRVWQLLQRQKDLEQHVLNARHN